MDLFPNSAKIVSLFHELDKFPSGWGVNWANMHQASAMKELLEIIYFFGQKFSSLFLTRKVEGEEAKIYSGLVFVLL